MNKLTFTTSIAALLLSTGAAFAADVSAPAAHDWTGFYIGANAGAAWSSSEIESKFTSDGASLYQGKLDNKINDDGAVFSGGGLVGYNWQHDALVLGVEADINYADFGGSDKGSYNTLLADYSSKLDWDANWFGTIRGRLGFASDNFLVYGTGGLAYGSVQANGNVSVSENFFPIPQGEGPRLIGSVDNTQWGWTIGGGAEYALSDHVSVGAEYLYVDLGSDDFKYKAVLDGETKEGRAEVDYRFSVARATIKYAF